MKREWIYTLILGFLLSMVFIFLAYDVVILRYQLLEKDSEIQTLKDDRQEYMIWNADYYNKKISTLHKTNLLLQLELSKYKNKHE